MDEQPSFPPRFFRLVCNLPFLLCTKKKKVMAGSSFFLSFLLLSMNALLYVVCVHRMLNFFSNFASFFIQNRVGSVHIFFY